MTDRYMAGIALAVLAAIGYGISPPLIRLGYDNGVPTLESILWRIATITILLGAVQLFSKRRWRLTKAAAPALMLQFLATTSISFGYLGSVQFIPVSQAVIIFFMFPIFILLTAPLAEGMALSFRRLAVAVLAFSGLAIAIGPGFHKLDLFGVGLAAIASIGAVLQYFSGRALAAHFPAGVIGFLVHLMILPLTLMAALYAGGGELVIMQPGQVSRAGFAALIILGLAYVWGYFCHMKALSLAPPSLLAPFSNLEPLIVIVTAYLVLGETLQPDQYIGGGVVLTALVLSGYIGTRRKAA